jgi:hypothetical protein
VKYAKVAAAVAGSVIAAGVGGPAFADGGAATAPPVPTSISGGVEEVMAAQPVRQFTEGAHLGSALKTADDTVDGVAPWASAALPGQADGPTQAAQAPHAPEAAKTPPSTAGSRPAGATLGGLPLGDLAALAAGLSAPAAR